MELKKGFMMKSLKIIFSIFVFILSFSVSFAAINMTVSPIKYELE